MAYSTKTGPDFVSADLVAEKETARRRSTRRVRHEAPMRPGHADAADASHAWNRGRQPSSAS